METRTKDQALRAYFSAISVADPLRAQFWSERDLTVAQVRLLFLLMARDGQSMTELADQFGVALPTMTRLVDRVAQDRLVVRGEDPRDRRLVRLFITERIFERMGDERTAVFIEALRDFKAAADESTAGAEFRP